MNDVVNELINRLNEYRSMGDKFYPEDIIITEDIWLLLSEIERLNNIINELNNAYCKVITKCEEIIDNRFYMNDNAIKKYADEIKDICKYYVGEAKELKGDDKE